MKVSSARPALLLLLLQPHLGRAVQFEREPWHAAAAAAAAVFTTLASDTLFTNGTYTKENK